MTNQKWGESFLKSGLPLEHLTLMTFESLGWLCSLHYEYLRENREGETNWFELDIQAYSPKNDNGFLRFLVECKYNDLSKHWFFMPCETTSHTAQYEAVSAGQVVESNQRVLNFAPYEALSNPLSPSMLSLAPKSVWGVVVSQDGTKQENTIYTAINQLAYGFVPYSLDNFYRLTMNYPTALIPIIVTNAKIFRLKPSIADLDIVREASSPTDIADELDWTWCYHACPNELLGYNSDLIDRHDEEYEIKKYPVLNDRLLDLWQSPTWIAVVNINSLENFVQAIYKHFVDLPKDFKFSKNLKKIMIKERARLREKYSTAKDG
jgi:hypothetical protein